MRSHHYFLLLSALFSLKSEYSGAATFGNGLVGRWHIVSASEPLPEACKKLRIDFKADGQMLGADGFRIETKKWVATVADSGFVVNSEFVSDNGKPNCQGLESAYIRKNSISQMYVELLEDGRILKMSFSAKKDPTAPYMLFQRSAKND